MFLFIFQNFKAKLRNFATKEKTVLIVARKQKAGPTCLLSPRSSYPPTLPSLSSLSLSLSLSRPSLASFALRCDAERRRSSAPDELSAGCFVFRERVSVLSVRRIDHQLASTIFIASYYLGNWNVDRTFPPQHLLSLWVAWPAWFAESSSCGL